MFNIRYDVGLNDDGRPYIILPEDYEQNPEDRFFALEVVRWMLQDLYARRGSELDVSTLTALQESELLVGQLGDEVAELLHGSMKAQGELDFMLDKSYHINVKSIEERDALPDNDIFFDGKIFDRVEGLIVLVITYDSETYVPVETRYKLVDGITNEHWEEI